MVTPASLLPRVGLIGVSGYASTYLQLALELHDTGRIVLCGVVIINPLDQPGALAALQQRKIAVFADFRVMLAQQRDRLELCLIPTGIPWHARMTIAALEAGANVLVEKPLAGSLADGQAIRRAEEASGRFVAVGFQDIYTPEVRRLKSALGAGIIGRLTAIRLLGLWPRPAEYYTRNEWAGRLYDREVAVFDSPLNNAFAHFANLCLFFAGSAPTRASLAAIRSAELLRAHAIESFDTVVVQATLEGGLPLWIGLSHACAERHDPEIVFEGTGGRCTWRHEAECVIEPSGQPAVRFPLTPIDDARRTMFLRIVERLRDPTVFICDTGLAAAHLALVEQVHAGVPIHLVPREYLDFLPDPDTTGCVPVVRGLTLALRQCFAQQSNLFSSALCPAIAELKTRL